MRISVKAKPNAKENKVEKIDESNFVISVKKPPIQGRANEAIINALAEFLGISKFQIKIISGWTSRQKVIEVIGKLFI